MQKEVSVIFEGVNEILNTIDSEGEIVTMLGLPSEKCALIGSTIKLTKFLGGGTQGEAFQIEIPGMGEKVYVVKKADLTLQVLEGTQQKVENKLQTEGYSWNDIEGWQPQNFIDQWENANHHDKVKVVIPPKMCLQKGPTFFPIIPLNGIKKDGGNIVNAMFEVPKGSYICENASFSELAIAIYAGKLYRDGICANFFNTYSMFTCANKEQYDTDFMEYQQYTFMDKIDGEINKYGNCITWNKYIEDNKRISPDITNGIYIQTLFAIAAYQHHYKISHNDLHTGNLFVEVVTPKTMFGGKNVAEYDFYHYQIADNDIYIPVVPILAKIGDYGLSSKYTKPIIGNYEVFIDGMNTDDGTGAWIPTVYLPSYDSLYFTGAYAQLVVKDRKYSNATELLQECISFMCPGIEKYKQEEDIIQNLLINSLYIKKSNGRPILENLIGVKDARDVLLGPVLKYYSKKPHFSAKILTLGKI